MSYDATYERLALSATFDLKGAPDDLRTWCGSDLPVFPEQPNTLVRQNTRHLAHIGPEHWLLWDQPDQEDALIGALRPTDAPSGVSIVQVSDAYARFRVVGPDAVHIMSIASPLDLHASVFAENACSFTEIFSLKGLVWRNPHGFEFAVERSFGDMIVDYLERALGHR